MCLTLGTRVFYTRLCLDCWIAVSALCVVEQHLQSTNEPVIVDCWVNSADSGQYYCYWAVLLLTNLGHLCTTSTVHCTEWCTEDVSELGQAVKVKHRGRLHFIVSTS